MQARMTREYHRCRAQAIPEYAELVLQIRDQDGELSSRSTDGVLCWCGLFWAAGQHEKARNTTRGAEPRPTMAHHDMPRPATPLRLTTAHYDLMRPITHTHHIELLVACATTRRRTTTLGGA